MSLFSNANYDQKRIWLECGGKVDYKTECLLGDRLGWLSKDQYNYSLDSSVGHLLAAKD